MKHTKAGSMILRNCQLEDVKAALELLGLDGVTRILYPGSYHDFVDNDVLMSSGFEAETGLGLGDEVWAIEDQDGLVMFWDIFQHTKKLPPHGCSTGYLMVARHSPELGKDIGRQIGRAKSYRASCLVAIGRFALNPDVHGETAENMLLVDRFLWVPEWNDQRVMMVDDHTSRWINDAILAAIEELEWFRRFSGNFQKTEINKVTVFKHR